MPNRVSEAVELADEFVKQGGESETEVANDTISVMQAEVESKVVSFSANLDKAREEVASGKEE